MKTVLNVLIACLVSSSATRALADDQKNDRATLRGIASVVVLVGNFGSDTKSDGLTEDQVQTDTELRLRKAGVKVLTLSDVVGNRAFILLIKSTFVKPKSSELYAVNCSVSLVQYVIVSANGVGTTASTWSDAVLLTVGSSKMSMAVRETIGDLVDEFVNAYLSVNPK
jgi:hypothetical protein